MFDPHLTLDLYSCNKKKLADKKFIPKVLEELSDLIEMRKISKPEILEYPGNLNSFDAGGISAFILIAESHISIHTFVKQAFASVDVFSCKDFDIKKAEDYIIKSFEPKEVEKAKEIVLKTRKMAISS